ncbi:MAG: anthranilate synthase component I family protein [Acidobacteriota bacterium]|nr:anthranilate synthase component I family protein [Acidobacteriota bacterium]
MAALTKPRSNRPEVRAELLGPAWGKWRGGWESRFSLVGRGQHWVFEDSGREISRWPDLAAAFRDLWANRSVCNGAPWAVGWLGYEACAEFAGGLPVRDVDPALPTGALLVEPGFFQAAPTKGVPVDRSSSARWSLDGAGFRESVATIRERIAAGDVYQVNLSRRLTIDDSPGNMDAFAQASCVGGIPDYLARFHFGDGELMTASMELLLRRRGSELETQPIKGTRRRGRSEAQDRDLAAELDADPKELAELAMIVDLERNDLGRVCETGSVKVVDAGSVCTYPAVHHRVATVTGQLRPGLEWWDALAAMCPGGSVTGCPKIAAMEVIAELEPVPRGPFAGALGVIGGNGDLEMALPIRSAWSMGGRTEFAAGCGIVWESDPVAEEIESRIKVARWLELVEGVG